METGHDLGLTLGHVKRRTVGLGHTGDQVHQEQREQRQPVPGEDGTAGHALPLLIDDVDQVQAAGHHHHANQGKTHGQFVRHDLCRRTQRTQEGVLGVTRPAGHDHAIHAHGRNGHDVQQRSVDVGQYHGVIERDHRPGS